MVRSYLKYEQSQSFGVVTQGPSNSLWAPDHTAAISGARNTGAGLVYTGANEDVLCWDIKKSELLSRWRADKNTAEVTTIARSNTDPDIFAIGYADGSIRLWDSRIATVIISFNGHRSAITRLVFDQQGVKLASGSRDTDIIVWDLVAEAGLYKLRGHKDQITGLHFIQTPLSESNGGVNGASQNGTSSLGDGFILSTSKDATIKLWDVASQYCIETHITQSNGECWALAVSPGDNGCITAGNEGELKVWTIDLEGLHDAATQLNSNPEARRLHERGTINRQGRDRTTGIMFHPTKDYFAVHGSDKSVELFRIRSQEEVDDALKRRKRRQANKDKKTGKEEEADAPQDVPTTSIGDYFVPYEIVRTGGKVRSIAWTTRSGSKFLEIMVATSNNQLELFKIVREKDEDTNKATVEYDRTFAVESSGHRTDIRAVSLSSDDRMLATASSGSLKIWNVRTQTCLRTLDCGYALCASFLPGDKIVIVGNKNGELELFDIASSALIDTVKAHEGAVWTLQVHPDGRSVVTGSADKTAKFWNFEIVQEEIPGTRRTVPKFKLAHTRTLKVTDDILNVCFSPDSRLLAVSTLDNTVKVFFADSLKLFLNLYGHKLPVLNMSISSDSKLIATCSADKNVRIWGLDFGDCHKAFFAHDESIMQVAFIPHPINREDAHLFFSASKDHLLKSWDGDKFEHIQKLPGHHGEIWAMTMSRTGDFVVTASHDKSIRIWAQTDEPLFLEEEREKELEELYDSNLTASLEKDQADAYAAADGAGEDGVASASKQTAETLTAGEKITEALAMCTEDLEIVREYEASRAQNPGVAHAAPQRHPVLTMQNQSAETYLLGVFEAIPSAALHDALLLLSFTTLPSLFVFLSLWLQKSMNVQLTCRILFFLLKTHHRQIVASRELRGQIQDMRVQLRECLGGWKDMLGFNLAATKVLGSRLRDNRIKTIEDEDARVGGGGKGVKKRTFVSVA